MVFRCIVFVHLIGACVSALCAGTGTLNGGADPAPPSVRTESEDVPARNCSTEVDFWQMVRDMEESASRPRGTVKVER